MADKVLEDWIDAESAALVLICRRAIRLNGEDGAAMRSTRALWSMGVLVTLFLTTGCTQTVGKAVSAVTRPVGSVGKKAAQAVSKPFQDDGESVSSRGRSSMLSQATSDSYAASNTAAASTTTYRPRRSAEVSIDPDKEVAVNQVLGSDPNNPTSADVAYVGSALEEEYRRLDSQAKLEYEKLKHYEEKEQELVSLSEEYRLRHEATLRKRENLKRIMSLLEKDPGALAKMSPSDQALARENGLAPADSFEAGIFGDDISSCAAPGGWKESAGTEGWAGDETAGQSYGQDSFAPPPSVVGADDGAWNPSRADVTGLGNSGGEQAPASDKSADSKKMMTTTILAMDGNGAEATLILNAGQKQGVDRGMIFATGKGDQRNVLVVTKSYPTYCRAVPHPKYAAAPMQVREEVTQIESLTDFQ